MAAAERGDAKSSGAPGARILIVEPISRRISPWWDDWAAELTRNGGRADEWRLPIELPEKLQALDEAAGLNHKELTARSIWAGVKSRLDP